MEILGQLGIDIPTFLAQIANFLALVFILRFILYKPLARIFEDRAAKTKELAEGLATLEQKRKTADEEAHALRAHASQEAQAVLERAKKSAAHFQEKRVELTEQELDKMIEESRLRIQAQKLELERHLRRDAKKEVIESLTQFFSQQEISRALHAKLVAAAIARMPEIIESAAVPKGQQNIEIATAFMLSPREENSLRNRFKKRGVAQNISVIKNPGLIAGLRIKLGSGHLFDFSFLGRLEKELAEEG